MKILETIDMLFVLIGQWLVDLTVSLGGSQALGDWIVKILAAVVIMVFILLNVMILVTFERRISAWIQERLGPNRVGPTGIFQIIMDVLKLVSKNTIIPAKVDRVVYRIVPLIVFGPVMLMFSVMPLGEGMTIYDSDVSLLLVLAFSGITTLILLMSGWAANNKFTLMGGMRATLQMISYEIPLLLTAIALVMAVGSLNLNDVVYDQIEHGWFAIRQPLTFLLFLIAATAEINRSPFDLPEGEQELIAGYQTEYSGMRFAFMYLGEYAALFTMSWLIAVLFLGGWHGPILPGWLWLFLKTYLMVFINMWVRWTFPRIRIDHLMSFCWKGLIPVALFNLVLNGTIIKILAMFS